MTPSRQRRKEARPQELLQAALDLFVEKGYAATRAEEVARRAGVSKGTLYLYFSSKEELFKAVVLQKLAPVISVGQEFMDQFDGSAVELLHRLLARWWEDVGHTSAAGIFKLLLAEGQLYPDLVEFYVREVVAPSRALLSRVIQRGMDRKEFRLMEVEQVVHALIAPLQYVVLDRLTLGICGLPQDRTGLDSFLHGQLDLLFNGLLAAPNDHPPRPPAQAEAEKKRNE